MPLPKPERGEQKIDFVTRCMGNDVMTEEFPDQEQRRAVCERQWSEKRSWFEIRDQGNKQYEILVYDEVGAYGTTAKDFVQQLKAIPSGAEITVGIHSPGGSVADALAIYQALGRRRYVTTRVDGAAYSAASLIFMAGKDRHMPEEGALLMLHNPSGGTLGEADDHRKTAEVLDKHRQQLVSIYSKRTGKDAVEVEAMMDEETWLNPPEALEHGFATELTEAVSMTAHFNLDPYGFTHPPVSAGGSPATATPEPTTTKQTEESDMQNLVKALLAAGVGIKADASEEDVIKAILGIIEESKTTSDKNAELTAHLADQHEKAATQAVELAVASGRLQDDADLRSKWVEAYKANPKATADLLTTLPEPVAPGAVDLPAPGAAEPEAKTLKEQLEAITDAKARAAFIEANFDALSAEV